MACVIVSEAPCEDKVISLKAMPCVIVPESPCEDKVISLESPFCGRVISPTSLGKGRTLPKITLLPKPRAVLGCIQIATDFVLEREGPALVKHFPGVELRLQKVKFDSETISADTFHRAAKNISEAGKAMLPLDRCTVMGLACTSMSFTLGPEVVDEQLRAAAWPDVRTTDMARAQANALRALGVKKVALLTPYVEAVAEGNIRMLEDGGFQVVSSATMGLDRDELTTSVSPDTIKDWAVAVAEDAGGEAEALVIGCSAFRACEDGFITDLEEQLGIPVVTSTQAFLWHMLRCSGVDDRAPGYGRLLCEH